MNDIPTVGKQRPRFAHEKVSATGIIHPSRHLLRNLVVACGFAHCQRGRNRRLSATVALDDAARLVMEPTLDEALGGLFGTQQAPGIAIQGASAKTSGAAVQTTAGQPDSDRARRQFDDAEKAMEQGD